MNRGLLTALLLSAGFLPKLFSLHFGFDESYINMQFGRIDFERFRVPTTSPLCSGLRQFTFHSLQILCPHLSAMDPLYRDAQRSHCLTWGPPPTQWRPAASPLCHATRASSVRRCRGLLTRWPAEKATACRRRRTCPAVSGTCPTSTEALRSPSSQT